MALKISNAACPLGEKYGDLLKLEKSRFDRIVTKTCTLIPIPPPKEPLFKLTKLYSLNNFGLGNRGYKEYALYEFSDKPLTVSVTGTYKELQEIVNIPTRAHILEFNISCPNSTKPVISIKNLSKLNHTLPFGIKLPPYFDLCEIEDVAKKLKKLALKQRLFTYIVCCNTIPFEGIGGLGGPILKPISLYNIEYFKKLLPKIEIWGCGGIQEVTDLIEYELAGATGVQIGTAVMDKGLDYIDELIKLYREIH